MSIAASFTSSKVDCSNVSLFLRHTRSLASLLSSTALPPRGQNRCARDALPALNKQIQEKCNCLRIHCLSELHFDMQTLWLQIYVFQVVKM